MAQAVEWTFGGKLRAFRLTTRALERLEHETGKSFAELLVAADGQPSPVRLSVALTTSILWCALLWKEPELTRDQVQDWIDDAGLEAAMLRAVEIYGASLETFASGNPPKGGPSGIGTPPAGTPSVSG